MSEQDLDTMLRRIAETRVPRRGFLAAAGLTATSAFLAACSGGGAASGAPASAAASAAPGSAAPSAAASAAASPADSFAPAGEVEKQLFMYNWSEYINPENIEAYKAKFGVSKFQYDIYDNNEALIAKLQAGGGGYDIAAPTAEYVPGMVEGGFLQKLDKSRLPTLANIDPEVQGPVVGPERRVPDPEGLRDDRHPLQGIGPAHRSRRPGRSSSTSPRGRRRARRSSSTRWATCSCSR